MKRRSFEKAEPMNATLVRILLGCLAIAASLNAGENSEVRNAPAVRVNTQTISLREVEILFLDGYTLIQDKLRRGEVAKTDLDKLIRLAWNEAIETATQDKVLDQEARKNEREIRLSYAGQAGARGEEFLERQLQAATRELRTQMIAAAGGEDELRKALRRRGQTLQDWDQGVRRELFRREVLYRRVGRVRTSPAIARNFFQKHPELFRSQEGWKLRRIRLAKSVFPSVEAAQAGALKVAKKLASGADFAETASQFSDDPEFAAQGGLMVKNGEEFSSGGTYPSEEQLAHDLKDGGISEPVDIGNYYLIVQRVGYRPSDVQSFDKVVDKAEALAYTEKLKEAKKSLFEKLKAESAIEVIEKNPPARYLKGVDQGLFEAPPDRDQFGAP